MKNLLSLLFIACISITAQAQNLPEFNDKPAYSDPKTKQLIELEKSQYNTMAKAKGIFKAEGGFSLNGISSSVKLPKQDEFCLLYTSPSPRDRQKSRMPSSA